MKVEKGNKIKVHYVGTLENGEEFDSSRKRGETLNFEVGAGQMIAGFDSSVEGMTVGEIKDVVLEPTQAYGVRSEDAVMPVSRKNFPDDFKVEIGAMVQGSTKEGMPIQATIVGEDEENLILDMNHPLASKTLNFNIELVEIGE
jgi:FKBP-type peptidyl-prolyl cis-trans isomerase 2|tara:strand:- start:120 stop:551 length:432 start_codon:yes stop_codon:yes gene_type:complete